jgi:hypothetical protein
MIVMIPARVSAADEVCFTRDSVINFHNLHVWAKKIFMRCDNTISSSDFPSTFGQELNCLPD